VLFVVVVVCYREVLKRSLFSANEILQKALLHVRMLCERALSSNVTRDDLNNNEHSIIMIDCEQSVTYSLSEFKLKQHNQIKNAMEKLKLLKEEIMDVAYASCIVNIEKKSQNK
jgi:hypothetical protein